VSLIKVEFQVTAGVCAGFLAAQIYNVARAEIKAYKRRQHNREKPQNFNEENHDEAAPIPMEAD
jgi:hypothetical protein